MAEEKLSEQGLQTRAATPRRNHHRKHGYRGYGSGYDRGTEGYGGTVHWGRGFAGLGSPGWFGGTSLPQAGLFSAEVWERGPYAGLAPKGYSRSDERIREEICEELTRRHDIDPSRLTVTVVDGEVTLEGRVRDLDTRRIVDDIASHCVGVQQLRNQLRIDGKNGDGSPPTNGMKRRARQEKP